MTTEKATKLSMNALWVLIPCLLLSWMMDDLGNMRNPIFVGAALSALFIGSCWIPSAGVFLHSFVLFNRI